MLPFFAVFEQDIYRSFLEFYAGISGDVPGGIVRVVHALVVASVERGIGTEMWRRWCVAAHDAGPYKMGKLEMRNGNLYERDIETVRSKSWSHVQGYGTSGRAKRHT